MIGWVRDFIIYDLVRDCSLFMTEVKGLKWGNFLNKGVPNFFTTFVCAVIVLNSNRHIQVYYLWLITLSFTDICWEGVSNFQTKSLGWVHWFYGDHSLQNPLPPPHAKQWKVLQFSVYREQLFRNVWTTTVIVISFCIHLEELVKRIYNE